MFQIIKYDPFIYFIDDLLNSLKIKHTTFSINAFLDNHPFNRSLLAIVDCVENYNINVEAYLVNGKLEHIHKIPTPFIVNTKSNGFLIVSEINENEVIVKSQSKIDQKREVSEFINDWDGNLLVFEPKVNSMEKDYIKNHSIQKALNSIPFFLAFFLILTLSLSAYKYYDTFSLSRLIGLNILFTTFYLGSITSFIIMWFEIDKYNPTVKSFCTGKIELKLNCDAVINSKSGKLLKWITWGEIGFFYFSGSFLILLISLFTNNINSINTVGLFSLIALPFTFFSIYFQWKVVQQWCKLCLVIQALLILTAITSVFSSFVIFPELSIETLLHISFSFFLPILFWLIMKSKWVENLKLKKERVSLLKLKYNENVFSAFLNKSKVIQNNPNGMGIILGNSNAQNTIIKVCNPFCSPCASAHQELKELVNSNPDIKVQIIFNATTSDDDKRKAPVSHFVTYAEYNNMNSVESLLDNWYSSKTKEYEQFKNKFPLTKENILQNEKIDQMSNWCIKEDIQFTPTIFINGFQLPSQYKISELNYFL